MPKQMIQSPLKSNRDVKSKQNEHITQFGVGDAVTYLSFINW